MTAPDPLASLWPPRTDAPKRVLWRGPPGRTPWLLFEALAVAGHGVLAERDQAPAEPARYVEVLDSPGATVDVVIHDPGGCLLAEPPSRPEAMRSPAPNASRTVVVAPPDVAVPACDLRLVPGDVTGVTRAPWLAALVDAWVDPEWVEAHASHSPWAPVHVGDVVRAAVMGVERGGGVASLAPAPRPTVASLIGALAEPARALGLPPPAGEPRDVAAGPPPVPDPAVETLGWEPVVPLLEGVRDPLRALARRRLDGDGRHGATRSFRIQGRWWRLVDDPSTRARDLGRGTVTLRPAAGGPEMTVRPADLGAAAPGAVATGLRRLTEEVLERGFDDDWLHQIVTFAARNGLLAAERRSGLPGAEGRLAGEAG